MNVKAESVTRKLKPVSANLATALSTQDLIKSAIAAAKHLHLFVAKVVKLIKFCIAAIL